MKHFFAKISFKYLSLHFFLRAMKVRNTQFASKRNETQAAWLPNVQPVKIKIPYKEGKNHTLSAGSQQKMILRCVINLL